MNRYLYFLLAVLFAFSFFALGWLGHSQFESKKEVTKVSLLEKIKKKEVLNVVLLESPSTYFIGVEGKQGFEYDLLSAYAKHLGVKLKITPVHTIKEALELSKDPNIDITSASITKTPLRQREYNFGPSYYEVQEQVICNRRMQKRKQLPKDVEDLSQIRLVVGEDTSYAQTLQTLQNDGFDINVSYTSGVSTQDLLEKVSKNEIACTIADSNIYTLNLRYYPEIVMAFTISGREQLAWVLPEGADKLKSDMYKWLNAFTQQGEMTQLKDHYYAYVMFFDYYNTKMFYKRMKTRLPKFEKYFKEAAKYFGIPWQLLASISYQESLWNPNATSFTGVRGLMMLTQSTAKMLKVKNRLDPKESIMGGTKHIKQMLKYVPKGVKGENRLKFALAAYNIGLGHVKDAQSLAKEIGLDENRWKDLKIVLPLLSQKKYYRDLKYGYARGEEPVKYVEAIYNYRQILENKDLASFR